MTEVAHTPGPWEVSLSGRFIDIEGRDHPVCEIIPKGNLFTHKANAHLIAAAPDLLANEQKNLATMEWTRRRMIEWGKSTEEFDTAIEQTRAVISKALGAA